MDISYFFRKKEDQKGVFSRKLAGTAKQQTTRLKDRQRKDMAQKLSILNKVSKYLLNDKYFEFFAMFKSKGETHFAGFHDLLKRFKNNENLIDFQNSMFETRIDSVVRKLHLQRDKRVAVDQSPTRHLIRCFFCLAWVLQLPKRLIWRRRPHLVRTPLY